MWKSEPSMQLYGDLQTDTGRVSTPCCRSRARDGERKETLRVSRTACYELCHSCVGVCAHAHGYVVCA